jgi:hypothetical protein
MSRPDSRPPTLSQVIFWAALFAIVSGVAGGSPWLLLAGIAAMPLLLAASVLRRR